MRLLESDLGFKILDRTGNRTEITPRARAYAEEIRSALGIIAASSARVSQHGLSGRLTISAPPGFASSWLCLHLSDFLTENPDVVLNVVSARNLADTSNPEIDTFITFGYDARAHANVEPLLAVEFTPLCSPAYLGRFKSFNDPGILADATLLHMNDFTDWENWLQTVGLPPGNAHRGICYSDMNIVHAAVLAGEGIAIGDTVLWRDDLKKGLLMRPFSASLHLDTGYYLCTPTQNLGNPIVVEFHNWLKRLIEVSRFRSSRGP